MDTMKLISLAKADNLNKIPVEDKQVILLQDAHRVAIDFGGVRTIYGEETEAIPENNIRALFE